MISAKEMQKLAKNAITNKINEIQHKCLEKIENKIMFEASCGAFYCYISDYDIDCFNYMCNGDSTEMFEILVREGYTIIPLYNINGELYSYKIEWK